MPDALGKAVLVARLLMFGVFVVAGLAKLADREGSRRALVGFGLPTALASPLGTMLPIAELVVAGALLPISTVWMGGVGTVALLSVFILGIGFNLIRGRTPDCHCFGQLHSAPAGWSTLIRNVALAVTGGLSLCRGGMTRDLA